MSLILRGKIGNFSKYKTFIDIIYITGFISQIDDNIELYRQQWMIFDISYKEKKDYELA